MKLLIIAIMAASLMVSGCSNMSVYTFKKDRVDQKETGNRGYLSGDAPQETGQKAVPQRTLIGVDIELPGGGDGPDMDSKKAQVAREPEAPSMKKGTVPEPANTGSGTTTVVVEEETFVEEEYIK